MNDHVNSESSASAPRKTPQASRPGKPRAKKFAGAPKPEKAATRRGAQTASTKSRKAVAKTSKTEPATKKHAEKLPSRKGTRFSPDTSGAESSRAKQAAEKLAVLKGHDFSRAVNRPKSLGPLGSEGSSSPGSLDVVPVSAVSKTAPKKAAPKKKAASKGQSGKTNKAAEATPLPQFATSSVEDPIGDVSDGEARTYAGEIPETEAQSEAEAYRVGVAEEAFDGTIEAHEADLEAEVDEEPFPKTAKSDEEAAKRRERDQASLGPPAKLERLQKILSQAGIASRRHAEEMIVAGRVEVNGQVVTVLGSKADPGRDHIRVDGKLLHGAERHRYFVLNKPKGYVTTVSDPEGRPTVMDFVRKLGERVYPVGRLDFQSEGLLLMTNDGALANQLTHASSGVEKTYVVKISGQPDEEELERLRNGVMIERGGPSSSGLYGPGGRVRTAPAQIRQIRPGENPWYEVVLTEGRNREIRKMFSAINHYVEKIRRVGYGPLALDVEPGKLRELTLEEVDLLRQASEGKLKLRRLRTEAMLPKEAGRTEDPRPAKGESRRSPDARSGKPHRQNPPERGPESGFHRRGEERSGSRTGSGFASRFGSGRGSGRGTQPDLRGQSRQWQPRPGTERTPRAGSGGPRRDFVPRRETQFGKPDFSRPGKPQIRKPEEGEVGSRPSHPGARSRSDAPQRPFRSERRSGPGMGGRGRSERPPKFAPKGNRPGNGPDNRYRQGRKPEQGGREQFSGERGVERSRGLDRFPSNPKPDRFHPGQRPGGSTGPRPGGRRAGGKKGAGDGIPRRKFTR